MSGNAGEALKMPVLDLPVLVRQTVLAGAWKPSVLPSADKTPPASC